MTRPFTSNSTTCGPPSCSHHETTGGSPNSCPGLLILIFLSCGSCYNSRSRCRCRRSRLPLHPPPPSCRLSTGSPSVSASQLLPIPPSPSSPPLLPPHPLHQRSDGPTAEHLPSCSAPWLPTGVAVPSSSVSTSGGRRRSCASNSCHPRSCCRAGCGPSSCGRSHLAPGPSCSAPLLLRSGGCRSLLSLPLRLSRHGSRKNHSPHSGFGPSAPSACRSSQRRIRRDHPRSPPDIYLLVFCPPEQPLGIRCRRPQRSGTGMTFCQSRSGMVQRWATSFLLLFRATLSLVQAFFHRYLRIMPTNGYLAES